MVRKVWCQEREVAGHIVIATTIKKQAEVNADTQLAFSVLLSSRDPAQGMYPATLITQSKTPS